MVGLVLKLGGEAWGGGVSIVEGWMWGKGVE